MASAEPAPRGVHSRLQRGGRAAAEQFPVHSQEVIDSIFRDERVAKLVVQSLPPGLAKRCELRFETELELA